MAFGYQFCNLLGHDHLLPPIVEVILRERRSLDETVLIEVEESRLGHLHLYVTVVQAVGEFHGEQVIVQEIRDGCYALWRLHLLEQVTEVIVYDVP